MMVGLASFVNEEGVEQHALLGARVQVHEDDLDRFDRFNGDPDPEPQGDESGQPESPITAPDETQSEGDPDPEPQGDESGQPAGNASLQTWRDWAQSKGATDADLEGLSRNEIRDQYGD